MAEKKLDKYNNPLGCMTKEEFDELKDRPYEELYQFLQNFKIIENKCPPEKKCLCSQFKCERCYARAIGDKFYDYVYGGFDKELNESKEKDSDED